MFGSPAFTMDHILALREDIENLESPQGVVDVLTKKEMDIFNSLTNEEDRKEFAKQLPFFQITTEVRKFISAGVFTKESRAKLPQCIRREMSHGLEYSSQLGVVVDGTNFKKKEIIDWARNTIDRLNTSSIQTKKSSSTSALGTQPGSIHIFSIENVREFYSL
ncbi:MAG: hypothetical protein P1V18_02190 [Candidatus Gracilibacteria bacterium]|nr:hypothetical protein [Candidatus Gracilibacteria bacterium]